MRNLHIWRRTAALFATLLLTSGAAAVAQAERGNVHGTVTDTEGSPLPGVSVTLSGIGAPRVQTSNAQGEFRFLGLDPGVYRLEAQLQGFSPLAYEQVTVNVGHNTTLELEMSSAVAETITVTGESPLLDQRKVTTGATVSQIELEKVPTARDPWVILGTTSGVQLDRINVGGNESGQQSMVLGPGDNNGNNASFAVDGVEITDIGAVGSSSSYYDFDAFEEMQVATGGSDVTKRTGGASLNLVTKRGTNEFRGSGRYLTADSSWQSESGFDDSDLGPGQPPFENANQIDKNEEYGAEIGGPILRDQLWFWLSYGESQINNRAISSGVAFSDDTTLETANAKVNWQITPQNSFTAFYMDNDKIKLGRNAGPSRPPATTWNQGSLPSEGDLFPFDELPTAFKLEDSHVFSSNFFVTLLYAENDGGFFLTPQGSLQFEDTWRNPDQPRANLDDEFVWHNTFLHFESARPQSQYKADASYFFNAGDVSHELKFGANYREGTVNSFTRWPGGGLEYGYYTNYGPYPIVAFTRDGRVDYEVQYTNGYIQDTISAGDLTYNVGVRYDLQEGAFLPGQVEANPFQPELLPAVEFAGGDFGYDWSTLSPRLGVTYDLGGQGKTLLRASYARFAEQLGGQAVFGSPLSPYSTVYFYYDDRNGDGHSSNDELVDLDGDGQPDLVPGRQFNSTYNPFDPARAFTSDFADPNLEAPLTDELVLGAEHALLPEFVVGLNVRYRLNTDLLEGETLVFDGDAFSEENLLLPGRKHTRDDYVLKDVIDVQRPDGSTLQVPVYGFRDGVTSRGGQFIENSDAEQEYLGVSLTLNKRLANRWMLRGNFTWSQWEWNMPGGEDENPNRSFDGALNTGFDDGGPEDGSPVLTCVGTGSGAKGNVCAGPGWSYDLTGLYQVMPDRRWGFDVSAHVYGREGYPAPYNARQSAGLTGFPTTVNLAATSDLEEFRNDDLHLVDLGLQKEFRFDKVGLTLSADLFNLFNDGSVLQRQLRVGSTTGHVFEVVSPRIWRLGARISFD